MNSHSNTPATADQYVPWEHDPGTYVEWWTRPGHPVGVMRVRDEESGGWCPYTMAYVEGGAPAGDAYYVYFEHLEVAQEAAALLNKRELEL